MSHFLKSIFQQRIPFIYLLLPFILLRPFPHSALSLPLHARSYPPPLPAFRIPRSPPSPISFSRTRGLAPFPNFVREATASPTGFALHVLLLPPPQSFVFFGPALSPCAAFRQPFRAKAAPFHHRFVPFAARRDAQPDKRALCGYVVVRATLSHQGGVKKSLRSPSPSLSLFYPPRNSLSLKSLPVPISATMPSK